MGGDLLQFEGEDGEEPTVIPIAEIVKQFMSRGITLNVSQVPQSISSHSISHYDALMELGDYSYHKGFSEPSEGTTNDTFFNNAIEFSMKKFLVGEGHCTEDEDQSCVN